MKKKFGFTLAEVLITLGIIGVVAALTAPALVKNSGQAKIGPSLAKFVNTWETGCEQMMTEEGASKLSNVTSKDKIMEALSKYMIMSKLDNDTIKDYKVLSPSDSDGQTIDFSDDVFKDQVYQLKDGSIVAVYNNAGILSWEQKNSYKGIYCWILYDINGLNGKNKSGSEVFLFGVDENGCLVPYMSNAYIYLMDGAVDQEACGGSNVWDGLACTGKIADNGWKADY